MSTLRKLLAMAAGATIALTAATLPATLAQQGGTSGNPDVLEVPDAHVEFIEESQVSALMEGIVESIELDMGRNVAKGGVIGHLYQKKAQLAVAKAKLGANNSASIEKAIAQKEQAVAVVARNERMLKRDGSYVSKEDQEKAIADWHVAKALIREAEEAQALAKAELDLAENQLDEHTIRAPFAGVIIKRLKQPGESVSAREPVVEMGNLDRLRVSAYIPVEYTYRVAEGSVVEFRPRIGGSRGTLPIEQKRFRGVITYVDPKIQPQISAEVKINAEFKNESHELLPGLKGVLTISLSPPKAVAGGGRPADPDAGTVVPTSTTAATRGGVELPQLPR